VDTEKRGTLVILQEEAELVRKVFETFLHEETLSATTKRLLMKNKSQKRTHAGNRYPYTHPAGFTAKPAGCG
jgi:hypothetical protein